MANNRDFKYETVIHDSDYLISHHRVYEVKIMPGITFLDMIYRALQAEGFATEKIILSHILFKEPVSTTALYDRKIKIQYSGNGTEGKITASSKMERDGADWPDDWVENFSCELTIADQPLTGRIDIEALKKDSRAQSDLDEVYRYARSVRIHHAEFMKGLGRLYRADDSLLAEIYPGELAASCADDFYLHPALLDASTFIPFQLLANRTGKPYIPLYIERFRAVNGCNGKCYVYARKTGESEPNNDLIHGDYQIYDEAGIIIAAFQRITGKRIRTESLIKKLERHPVAEVADDSRESGSASRKEVVGKTGPEPPLPFDEGIIEGLKRLIDDALGKPIHDMRQDTPFYDQGLDSADLVRISGELEKRLGTKLYPTLLFEYPTLIELAGYFEKEYCGRYSELFAANATAVGQASFKSGWKRESAAAADAQNQNVDADIAVIGMSGRYPQAGDLNDFWNHAVAKRNCVTEVPASRWDYQPFYEPDQNIPGKSYSKWGGFLDDIDKFDPLLFRITPLAAARLDPQARLMLETAWEVMEDAGYTKETLAEESVGVFIGVMNNDYTWVASESYLQTGEYLSAGCYDHEIANQISYTMNFRGPSLTVKTACSSSLTAIHLARTALLNGECTVALAGGVNLILHPSKYLTLSELQVISPSGIEKTFDASADGYVPGEGYGMVMLKPLARAKADHDRIYGIIKGSAMNNSGTGGGQYVPGVKSLAKVVEDVIRVARISPEQIEYIEAHGSGSLLGDSLEVQALAQAFSGFTSKKLICALGSKANLGHLESASGICSLTKVLLSLKHNIIPPCANIDKVSPALNLENSPFYIPVQPVAWEKKPDHPRYAGINSFGIGGSNCFILVAEYISHNETGRNAINQPYPIVISARNPERLNAYVGKLAHCLETSASEIDLVALAYTLWKGRGRMEERVVFITDSVTKLLMLFQEYQQKGRNDTRIFRSDPVTANSPEPAESFARQWLAGNPPEPGGLFDLPISQISLPTYPFERKRCWIETDRHQGRFVGAPPPDGIAANRLLLAKCGWKTAPLAQGLTLAGTVLIFDREERISQYLKSAYPGVAWIRVRPGTQFEKEAADAYKLNPANRDDYEALFAALFQAGRMPQTVLHLLAGEPFNPEIEAAEDWGDAALFSAFFISRELIKRRAGAQILYLYPAREQPVHPLCASVAGLARTLARETKDIRLKVIAADRNFDDLNRMAEIIVQEAAADDTAPEIRYGELGRQVRAYTEIVAGKAAAQTTALQEGGIYLITGGLGAIAGHMARYIAQKTKGVIVLIGRSAIGREQEKTLDRLKICGAAVEYHQADVADERRMAEIIHAVIRQRGRINGVLHCAGIIADGLVAAKEKESIQRVLRPKLQGVIVLDKLTRNSNLDFMVYFSSTAAAFGNPGQSDYAVANSFMDNYALYREALRRTGQRTGKTLSVNWPLWQEGGMTVQPGVWERLQATVGIEAIDTASACQALEYGLSSAESQLVVLKGDTSKMKKELGIDSAEASPKFEPPQPGVAQPRAEQYLLKLLAEQTGLAPHEINPENSLDNYGINSVLIMKLTAALEKRFGPLSKTLFFQYQTLAGLARYFSENYGEHFEAPKSGNAGVTLEPPLMAKERPAVDCQIQGKPGENRMGDEIAVIGMSGRYPGAEHLGELWRNLKNGKDCVSEIPAVRWDHQFYYDPEKGRKGKSYCKWGGFINDADQFDPLFFNIAPGDVQYMDPQERLFLQCVWHTLEDACYTRSALSRYQVGVYVGVMSPDYLLLGANQAGGNYVRGSFASIANRISYFFNFHGPSMAIDTMCSSSLTALHLAVQALQSGEIGLAVAGGVNLILNPERYVGLSQDRFLASEGRCRSFGKDGDGYVPGEGVGAVLLKPLHRALADHDHIYAVIKSSALNHGGKTNGYTVPNPDFQAQIIAKAIHDAGITPQDITYIEAHGTGTALGDPIEISGITAGFNHAPESGKQYCAVGSIKSNIGHLEAAAGIAGLTKVILQMQHRKLVPSLHSQVLNPHIDFARSPVYVQHDYADWEGNSQRRRIAGLSSFGAGGTNVHCIIEEFPAADAGGVPGPKEVIVTLSAKSRERLQVYAQQTAEFIEESKDARLTDIAYSLQTGRESLDERLAVVAGSQEDLIRKLKDFSRGVKFSDGIYSGNRGILTKLAVIGEETGRAFIVSLVKAGEFGKLAQLWVNGIEVDWTLLWADSRARRISLPGYPFARERYWLSQPDQGSLRGDNQHLHALVHQNCSTLDQHKYRTVFTGKEYYFTDHRVKGRKMLPGAVMIAMGLKAAELSGGKPVNRISNCTWKSPVSSAVGSESQTLSVKLATANAKIEYQLSSVNDGVSKLHACGALENRTDGVAMPDWIDPNQIKARCPLAVNQPDCYRYFREFGIEYGQGYRVIRELYANEGEVLAALCLPEALQAELGDYAVHPSILDGAFQSIIGFFVADQRKRLYLPYSIGWMDIWANVTGSHVWAYVKRSADPSPEDSGHSFDIVITESDGTPLVDIKNFTVKAAGEPAKASTLYFTPVLRERNVSDTLTADSGPVLVFAQDSMQLERLGRVWPDRRPGSFLGVLPGNEYGQTGRIYYLNYRAMTDFSALLAQLTSQNRLPQTVLFIAGRPSGNAVAADLENRIRHSFLALFYWVKSLIAGKFHGKMNICYIYPGGDAGPVDQAMAGFFKAVNLERPGLQCKLLGLPAEIFATMAEPIGKWIFTEARLPLEEGSEVVYKDNQRWIRQWSEVTVAQTAPGFELPENGVYLITGGLGALGKIFAKYLLSKRRHVKVVLCGRSPLTGERQEWLDSLNAPGRIVYYQADVAIEQEVLALVQAIKGKFGGLQGVIHSAGALRDSYVFNKTEVEIEAVLRPKVYGAVHLDKALCLEKLDFFIVFSSAVVARGNIGQSDYGYANAFLNSFVNWRKQQGRSGKTLAISWPLWRDGGMRAAEPIIGETYQQLGLSSLETQQGIAAFENAFQLDFTEMLVLTGDRRKILNWLRSGRDMPDSSGNATAVAATTEPDVQIERSPDIYEAAVDYLQQILGAELEIAADRIALGESLQNYGLDSIKMMNLHRELESKFPGISRTIFFEYPNIEGLANYFLTHHPREIAGISRQTAPTGTDTDPTPPRSPDQPVEPEKRLSGKAGSTAEDADIAVIGLSGRYPLAENLEQFWENLKQGTDCITGFPPERSDYRPGGPEARYGGFITGIDQFDPFFFKIAPLEAKYMDPQERIMLETAWRTIEDAGYTLKELNCDTVGVFVGVMYGHYQLYSLEPGYRCDRFTPTSLHASIANRISYTFNFQGPSIALDTMCSSSLTALHLGVQSIRNGESGLALIGGVNLSLHPNKYRALNQRNFLSSSGRCKSFGAGGDGYIPGEGVGALLLKPLSRAIRDKDHIYGLIKSTAINHGGKANAYTVPNPQAQSDLIIKAIQQAGINPDQIDYIEAHGTGTVLGDPVEITGLVKAFAHFRADGQRQACPIGSVKSNIGHLESASGLAAISKVLLQFQHNQLTPSIHAEETNPNIDFAKTPFYVQKKLEDWPRKRRDGHIAPHVAGVSSFGAGGANAHIILEEYLNEGLRADWNGPRQQQLILSAQTEERLMTYTTVLADYLTHHADISWESVAYTLQTGRESYEERLALTAASLDEAATKLRGFAGGEPVDGLYRGKVPPYAKPEQLPGAANLAAAVDFAQAAHFWVQGYEVDWKRLYDAIPYKVSLPGYPWERTVYWLDRMTAGPKDARVDNDPDGAASDSDNTIPQQPPAAHQVGGGEAETDVYLKEIGYYIPKWREEPLHLNEQNRCLAKEAHKTALMIGAPGWDGVPTAIGAVYRNPIIATFGSRFQHENGVWEIDGNDFAGLQSWLSQLPTVDIVYFLGGILPEPDTEIDILEINEMGIMNLFRCIKGLLACRYQQKELGVRVLVNNVNAVNATDQVVPWHGSLVGFTQSLAKEFPKWDVCCMDIALPRPQEDPEAFVAALVTESAMRKSAEIILRHNRVYRRVFVPVRLPLPNLPGKLRERGVYVILGGAGGIGLELGKYLTQTYRARVALIGRSALTPEKSREIEAMNCSGGDLIYVRGDAVQQESIRDAILEIKSRYGRIHGAIHSAIVLQDRMIANMDEATLRAVLGPKVEGSVYFYEALKAERLDFMYFFSSAQSFSCNPGQSNYAAGCTFKDAFARYLNGTGRCPATTVNWGYWGHVGVVSGPEYHKRLQEQGIGSIDSVEGMSSFVKILENGFTQVMAVKLKKEHLIGLGVDFSDGCPDREGKMMRRGPETMTGTERTDYPAEKLKRVIAAIKECIAATLETPAASIDEQRAFADYGIDSIIGVDLIKTLNETMGIALKTTALFDYTNVIELGGFIMNNCGAALKLAKNRREAPAETGPEPTVRVALGYEGLARRQHQRVWLRTPCRIEDIALETFIPADPGPDEVQIHIKAFSLNFGDLLCVKGLYPSQPDYPFTPGFEFAGIVVKTGRKVQRVKAGDEVIGLCKEDLGAQATCINVREGAVVPKPPSITMEAGCSFPIVYMTMRKAFELAQVRQGETVLIQTAAGGTGLIAVQLAQKAQAEIFATAGAQLKLDYLKQLGVSNLINYREEDFAERIMTLTNRRGVDVIFNTLSGEAIQKGLNILAPGGRYIEIAMTGLKQAVSVDLSHLVDNQVFYSIDLRKMFLRDPGSVTQSLQQAVRALEAGSVQPAVAKVFPFTEIQQAYSYMQERENIGKIVVRVEDLPETGTVADEVKRVAAATGELPYHHPDTADVAIIGMAGRFPQADNPEAFWQNIREGKSAITEAPSDRWNIDLYYDPDPQKMDKTDCPWGGFLVDIDRFDPVFFNISGKEAKLTDPQQRLFLEESYHALEDAGYVTGNQLDQRKCGIFVGVGKSDYIDLMQEGGYELEAQSFWGNEDAVLPARLAYYLNLHGPCMTVNTACSSALTAIYLATQSILEGQSEIAVAGGVFIRVTPKFHIINSNAQMLSPDGKCMVFDDRANGYVPGEGVGVVVLKRLDRALADRDHIYGVIKGIEINQDGKTNGITAPSARSQTELEETVYRKYGIHPETITMIEAHGTGTKLGDPIEVEALTAAFGGFTPKKGYCAIGSVKENIGHCVTAAGAASVLKVLLAMEHREIPPAVNFSRANQHIDFAATPFYINRRLQKWESNGTPLRAGVSAFGFSGTNVHLVIEAPPPAAGSVRRTDAGVPYVMFISAKTEAALNAKVTELRLFIERRRAELTPGDLSFTLCEGREHFAVRLSFVADSMDDVREQLLNFPNGSTDRIYYRNLKANPAEPELQKETYGKAILNEASRLDGHESGYRSILEEIASLYAQGYALNYGQLFDRRNVARISLPGYPFERKRYWLDDSLMKQAKSIRQLALPLLDKMDVGQNAFFKDLPPDAPIVAGHRVRNQMILAGAAQIEAVLEAAAGIRHSSDMMIRDLLWMAPLEITAANHRIKVIFHGIAADHVQFEVQKGGAVHPTVASRGELIWLSSGGKPGRFDVNPVKQRCRALGNTREVHYSRFEKSQIEYGEFYQCVKGLWAGPNEALAAVGFDPERDADATGYMIHPGLLDSAFQITAHLVGEPYQDRLLLPYGLKSVRYYRTPDPHGYAYVRRGPGELSFQIRLINEDGEVCVEIEEFCLREAASGPDNIRLQRTEAVFEGLPVVNPDLAEENIAAMDQLVDLAHYSLLNAVQRMGGLLKSGGSYESPGELQRELMIQPKYTKLCAALLDILAKAGFIAVAGAKITVLPVVSSPEAAAKLNSLSAMENHLMEAHPAIAPHIRLLSACLSQYPEILRGNVGATDILFPASSMDLVEGIYKGNYLSAYFNRLVVCAVRNYIQRKNGRKPLEKDQIKMIEIGAGTGGTSSFIFERVREFSDQLSYCYTDISNGFLNYGRKNYGSRNSYIDFKLLNIAEDLAPQGFGAREFDVVIATNVLHATANLHAAVANCKMLLAEGGWLIINEVTAVHDFTTLTFGLLDGWWLFEDGEIRLANSPLLSEELWRTLLTGQGFRIIENFGLTGCDGRLSGQNVMICEPDAPPSQTVSPGVPAAAKSREHSSDAPSINGPDRYQAIFEQLEDTVLQILAQVLQIDPDCFDLDSPYSDFGIDSLLAVKIVEELNARLGIELRSTELFNYASIRKLIQMIICKYGGAMEAEPGGGNDGPGREDADGWVPTAVDGPDSGLDATAPEDFPSDPGIQAAATEIEQDHPGMSDGIAIIGMSGRFPDARNVEEFSRNLARGLNSIKEVARWNLRDFYHPEIGVPGKSYCKNGGLLEEIYRFEPLFFNISPREAESMDPQQRIFLEEAWKALEDAGYSDRELDGRYCSLFVGCTSGDYARVIHDTGLPLEGYTFSGNSGSILAARIGYFLNLKGASIAIDTACSSSLVAIHLACERLRLHPEEMAVAGGVMVMNTPDFWVTSSQSGMLSEKGGCFPFDDQADGFVPGEACGVLILKPLKTALRDCDHIYGVIRGSGINQDGKTNGITAPSAPSQTALECDVYRRFQIDPAGIGYIEAHGTGTKLGDPIEIQALTDAFGQYTDRKRFCAIGSVKANIGHSLTAAGIAGMVKLLLTFKDGVLFPSVSFASENRHIDFANSPFYVNVHLKPWERSGNRPRLAAISSFGFSGTNAHIVIEEPPLPEETVAPAAPYFLIAVSAKTAVALRQRITDLLNWLIADEGRSALRDIAYTLLIGRSHFHHRISLVVDSITDLKAKCDGLLKEIDPAADTGNHPLQRAELNRLREKGVWQLAHLPDWSEPAAYQKALAELAEIYQKDCDLDWKLLYPAGRFRKIALPTYPFAGACYHINSRIQPARTETVAAGTSNRFALIPKHTSVPEGELFHFTFDGSEKCFAHHRVRENKLLPAAVYLELARSCGGAPTEDAVTCIQDVLLEQPITQTDPGRPVEVWVKVFSEGRRIHFEVCNHNLHVCCARGTLAVAHPFQADHIEIAAVHQRMTASLNKNECYNRFELAGMNYGPGYQGLEEITYHDGEALALLKIPPAVADEFDGCVLNPYLLDGALQSVIAFRGEASVDPVALPVAFEQLIIFGAIPAQCYAYSKWVGHSGSLQRFNVSIYDCAGHEKVRISNFTLKPVKQTVTSDSGASDSVLRDILSKIRRKELSPREGDIAINYAVNQAKMQRSLSK